MGDTPRTFTSLDAVTAAANGSSRRTRGPERITVELNWTGTPTAVDVRLESRIGSGDWTQIGRDDQMTDAPADADADFLYQFQAVDGEIRLRLVTMTGGTSPTCTGKIRLGGVA